MKTLTERQLTIIYSAVDVEYVRMILKTVAVAKDDVQYHEAREDLREMKELMTLIDQMTDDLACNRTFVPLYDV